MSSLGSTYRNQKKAELCSGAELAHAAQNNSSLSRCAILRAYPLCSIPAQASLCHRLRRSVTRQQRPTARASTPKALLVAAHYPSGSGATGAALQGSIRPAAAVAQLSAAVAPPPSVGALAQQQQQPQRWASTTQGTGRREVSHGADCRWVLSD